MIRKVPELSDTFLPVCAKLLHERHHGETRGLPIPSSALAVAKGGKRDRNRSSPGKGSMCTHTVDSPVPLAHHSLPLP